VKLDGQASSPGENQVLDKTHQHQAALDKEMHVTVHRRGRPGAMLALVTMVVLALSACSAGTPSTSASGTASPPAGSAAPAESNAAATMPPAEQDSITFGISAIDPHQFQLQLALDAGLFEKYGIKAQGTYFDGSQKTLQALLAGQIDFATSTSSQTITTLTTNTPAVDIAVMINKLPDYIYGAKGITSADQLKGKKVAISQLGTQSHAEMVVGMKELGLAPTDVTMTPIGGQSARVAALEAGTVLAAPADPALADKLTGEGFSILVKLPEAASQFAGSNVMVLRSYADKNPNTTLAVAAAVLEATQLPYTDLDTVVKAYAKWAQVDEAEAKANWQAYLDSGIAQRDLRSSVEAYQNARDVLLTVNPDVKDVDLSKAFDGSFLDKLEAMGLNDELGIPKS
jgi:NitT/TauT family transport system substrate-binding protein